MYCEIPLLRPPLGPWKSSLNRESVLLARSEYMTIYYLIIIGNNKFKKCFTNVMKLLIYI